MSVIEGYYDGVRYAPPIKRARPFQILGFTENWQGSVDRALVLFMSLGEAQDLHKSLGQMLRNVQKDSEENA